MISVPRAFAINISMCLLALVLATFNVWWSGWEVCEPVPFDVLLGLLGFSNLPVLLTSEFWTPGASLCGVEQKDSDHG